MRCGELAGSVRVMSLSGKILKGPFSVLLRATARMYPRGESLTRFVFYRHLIETLGRVPKPTRADSVLSVSGSSHLCGLLGIPAHSVVEANYPEHNVLSLCFESDHFEMVFFDQVLEHVEGNPQDAIDELYRILKPGGLLVCGTVLVYPIHGYPSDYWRFTPEGLKLLCRRFSKIVECGGWGNMYVWMLAWLGLHQDQVPLCTWHPLYRVATRNDPNWKIVTWIVAQK